MKTLSLLWGLNDLRASSAYMALRTWLLSWLRFSDSMGWIGGSGPVYLKMEPVLFILAYMIFLSCSRLITWVNFLVCKIRKAQMIVFTAAGKCLVNCYSCTGNKLNLAWAGRKLACSTLIKVVRFFSKRKVFSVRKKLQLPKRFTCFQSKLLWIQEFVSKTAAVQTDAYELMPCRNLIVDPTGWIP